MWLSMNCGSASDQYFVGGRPIDRGDLQVEGPGDPEFYQSARYDMSEYRIPLQANEYKVQLYFAETSKKVKGPEQRLFDVSLQGVKVLPNLDVFKTAGGWGQAICCDFVVNVDKELVIDFTNIRRKPSINAIVITDDVAANTIPRVIHTEEKDGSANADKSGTDTAGSTGSEGKTEAAEKDTKISGNIYKANNPKELAARLDDAKPGDLITLAAKEWRNAQITISAKGRPGKPIMIQAAERGKTKMTGNSKLVINGAYLIVDGVTWTDGQPRGAVVQFTSKSSHCRLTNSPIDVKGEKNVYVQIDSGAVGHRLDHCNLINKESSDALMRIGVQAKGRLRHRIDHCRIGPFRFINANGNEVIRLIASNLKNSDPKRGMERAECVIEHNLFDHANGEGKEIVSLKSSANVVRYNTFVACFGGPKARRGIDNRFKYNWFFGDNTKRPKGIYQNGVQILGSGHQIRGNYFEDMARGSGTVRIAAIVAEEGQGKPPKDKGWRAPVKDLTIEGNVLVNCDQNICFGAQYTKAGLRSDTPPKDVTVSNTRIISKSEPIRFKKQAREILMSWFAKVTSYVITGGTMMTTAYHGTEASALATISPRHRLQSKDTCSVD